MRKFKIKNRRKRKYVKKNDLTTSFSQTQSLTVGLVPLILMAIAFFTTAIMYSPTLASIHLPTLRVNAPVLPEVSLPTIAMPTDIALPKITLPTLPEFKIAQPELPKVSTPELPKIVLPNPVPYIITFGTSMMQAFNQIVQVILECIEILGSQMASVTIRIANFLDPRPVLVSIGNGLVFITTQLVQGLGILFTTIGQGIVKLATLFVQLVTDLVVGIGNASTQALAWFVRMIQVINRTVQQVTLQIITALNAWTQSAITATINGWNAFVWIIGTPFRAIGKAMDDFRILMLPVTDYLSTTMQHTSEDLSMGGKALSEGANYVSHSVEQNSTTTK